MYCLAYTQSGLCTAAIIFYTVLWLPLVQLKRAFIGLIFPCTVESHPEEFRLPAARFGDLKLQVSMSLRGDGNHDAGEGEVATPCSICLVDMEDEDVVSELPRCRHVFHLGCIERWLDKCQFTCPLCRSILFDGFYSRSNLVL